MLFGQIHIWKGVPSRCTLLARAILSSASLGSVIERLCLLPLGYRLAVGLPFEVVFLVDLARLRTTQTADGCFVASVVDWTTGIGAYILI